MHCVLSNDTDTFVLLLWYTLYFLSCGDNEIWLHYGIEDNERMLPIHEISTTMGPAQSKVMIKAHILTGEDIKSKVGTKHAAKVFDPARYLTNFGETPNLSEEDIRLAKEYLVKVKAGVKSKPLATTFDGLRHEKSIGGTTGINDLPSTRHTIHAHKQRGLPSIYCLQSSQP